LRHKLLGESIMHPIHQRVLKICTDHKLPFFLVILIFVLIANTNGAGLLSPSLAQAATPQAAPPIGVENAAQVKQLQMFNVGRGATFISRVAFSPDGKWLAVSKTYGAGGGTPDTTVQLWDVVADFKKLTLRGHTDAINDVAFSPDGALLASGSADETIRLWDVKTGKQQSIIQTNRTFALAINPDGTLLASAGDGISLWDIKTGKEVASIDAANESAFVVNIAFSPDGKLLAAAHSDNMVRLWDATSTGLGAGKNVVVLEGHTDRTLGVVFSPDGKLLASVGTDQTIRLWSMETKKQIAVMTQPDWVISVAFSPDGSLLATGSSDTTIRLWDAKTTKQLAILEGHTHPVASLSFNPSGTLLAAGDFDNIVRLWGLRI
jgi:WD40 repeat protein